MSMDKKLTSAVYAAVEKAYDHRCDIEDAADEILEIIKADRHRRGEPVAWPLASPEDAGKGWTLDYRFIEQVERAARQRTDYTTSMEATEQVLIAAAEVLGAPQHLSVSDIPAEPVKRKRRYAQGTALGEFGIIPMCDQVDDEPVKPHLIVSYDDKYDVLYVDCNDSVEPIDAEEDGMGILYRRANSDGRLVGITISNFMGQSRYGKGTP